MIVDNPIIKKTRSWLADIYTYIYNPIDTVDGRNPAPPCMVETQ